MSDTAIELEKKVEELEKKIKQMEEDHFDELLKLRKELLNSVQNVHSEYSEALHCMKEAYKYGGLKVQEAEEALKILRYDKDNPLPELHCPFCGAKEPDVMVKWDNSRQGKFMAVSCSKCGSRGPFGADRMEAIKLWFNEKE